MYKKILVPIDMGHLDTLEAAREIAANLAQSYGASIVYAAVTSALPGSTAHTPAEFEEKMKKLAAADGEIHGSDISVHITLSHDPAVDLEAKLLETIDAEGADLVVMGTHVPRPFWPSNGGRIASHSKASVFLVRKS